MIKVTKDEQWRQVKFANWQTMQNKYAVSNLGRLASYKKSVAEDGNMLKGSGIEGYKVLRLKVADGYVALLFHRMVAEAFCKKGKKAATFVIHLNHKKEDNRAANLQWATQEEVGEHNKQSPHVIAYRKKLKEEIPNIKKGLKLTVSQVKQIKKVLESANRKVTYKQLAAKYGVSEMAITRIRRGENWAHVKA